MRFPMRHIMPPVEEILEVVDLITGPEAEGDLTIGPPRTKDILTKITKGDQEITREEIPTAPITEAVQIDTKLEVTKITKDIPITKDIKMGDILVIQDTQITRDKDLMTTLAKINRD